MSQLWDIVQAHLDKYGVREAEFARRLGTSPQTLNSWKNRGVKALPKKRHLLALARETGTPYEVVLDAALHQIAYLPEEAGEDRADSPAPMSDAGGTPANVRPIRPVPKSSRAPSSKAARGGNDDRPPPVGDGGA